MMMTYVVLYLQQRSSLFKPWQPVCITSTPDRVQFGRTNKHKFDYSAPKGNRKLNLCGLGRNKTSKFGYQTPKCVSDANLYLHRNKSKFQTTWKVLNTPSYAWLKPRLQEIRSKNVSGQKYNSDMNLMASYFLTQYCALMHLHSSNNHKFKLNFKQQKSLKLGDVMRTF